MLCKNYKTGFKSILGLQKLAHLTLTFIAAVNRQLPSAVQANDGVGRPGKKVGGRLQIAFVFLLFKSTAQDMIFKKQLARPQVCHLSTEKCVI